MNESSVEKSIFISPRLPYKIKWSGGDELKLAIIDTLKSNQTYVITVGASAQDFHNNRMKSSYQFAFSSGNKIDRGEISGKVYNVSPKESFYIYAYQILDSDSVNPAYHLADFLSMPGNDGYYKLSYLASGFYRVFVVEDLNQNLKLDGNYERIGIPFRDIFLDSLRLNFKDLNFKVTHIDTIPPLLVDARVLNNRTIMIRFTEPVKYIEKSMLQIIDTLSAKNLDVFAYSVNKDDNKQYFIYTDIQDSTANHQINIKNIADTTGNMQMLEQTYSYQAIVKKDTSTFALLNISPVDSADNQPLSGCIGIQLSHPIDTLSLINNFVCWQNEDSTESVSGKWEWFNLQEGYFTMTPHFQAGQKYTFQMNLKNINSLWGETLPDSQITSCFFTVSDNEFGSLSGKYSGILAADEAVYISIIPLDKKKAPVITRVDQMKNFQVKWLESGKYRISGFLDRDGNSKYSYGNLFPFIYSEPFYFKSDTIRIRKRWELSGIEFNIPGIETDQLIQKTEKAQ